MKLVKMSRHERVNLFMLHVTIEQCCVDSVILKTTAGCAVINSNAYI